jgi:hypothetical protein
MVSVWLAIGNVPERVRPEIGVKRENRIGAASAVLIGCAQMQPDDIHYGRPGAARLNRHPEPPGISNAMTIKCGVFSLLRIAQWEHHSNLCKTHQCTIGIAGHEAYEKLANLSV